MLSFLPSYLGIEVENVNSKIDNISPLNFFGIKPITPLPNISL
jgi:hypothetical protein